MNRFGLYIHWPYCTHICPYCDFNIYRARGRDNIGLLNAILRELIYWRERIGARQLHSIYFGGGTPSLLEAAHIAQILEKCENLWGFEPQIEITLEANPHLAEAQKFKDFANIGINRLSLGAQSFDDAGLKSLGRFHSAQEAINATNMARDIFERLSIDLIYAREGQSLNSWQNELKHAIDLGVDHISPYQLTIEANTAFERKVGRGVIKMPNDDLSAQFYEITQEFLAANGFMNYEISNHANKKENQSKHNLLYWHSQDWLGIGAGAHGRINEGAERKAIINIKRPDEYINSISQNGHAIENEEILDLEEQRQEYYLMGLRLESGISMSPYKLNPKKILQLQEMAMIEIKGDIIRLSPNAKALSNTIIAQLLEE